MTCAQLKVFCNDLTNFLKDMIHSCPKAVAHYKELKAQYATQHKTGTDTGVIHEQQHNG
jgi:predicted GTPase